MCITTLCLILGALLKKNHITMPSIFSLFRRNNHIETTLKETDPNFTIAWLTNQLLLANETVLSLTTFRDQFPKEYPEVIPANIISRRDINNLHKTLILDRGLRDGINEGDIVLSGHNVIGVIAKVQESTCQVLLITDPDMRIPVDIIGALDVTELERFKKNIPEIQRLRNDSRNFHELIQLANKRDVEAQYLLGLMYETGKQGLPNWSKAKELYEKASKQGSQPAQQRLDYMMQNQDLSGISSSKYYYGSAICHGVDKNYCIVHYVPKELPWEYSQAYLITNSESDIFPAGLIIGIVNTPYQYKQSEKNKQDMKNSQSFETNTHKRVALSEGMFWNLPVQIVNVDELKTLLIIKNSKK
jgi:cell shape-determining protein MreC